MSKILLVTGGSRGIGAGIARMAGRDGYDVAVNYNKSKAGADAVVADIKRHGQRAIAIQADVSREADILRLFETVDRELGRLTAFVNNAGIIASVGRLEDFSFADIAHSFDVNATGPLFCAREAVRRMAKKFGGAGGAIVNIASAATTLGSANEFIHYAASKAAMDALTYGLSKEMALEGVRVNAVSPGYIETDIHYEGREKKILPNIPMQRAGTTEELAETVMFLLSEKASYVTGSILRVSGGR
jgi:NAD(P)-dependent dehydrogenase (short-subunit alcohol dehydrogenase family)